MTVDQATVRERKTGHTDRCKSPKISMKSAFFERRTGWALGLAHDRSSAGLSTGVQQPAAPAVPNTRTQATPVFARFSALIPNRRGNRCAAGISHILIVDGSRRGRRISAPLIQERVAFQ